MKSIIFDMDEVLCRFLDRLVRVHNLEHTERFENQLRVKDIVEWKLPDKLVQIYHRPYFFRYLEPYFSVVKCLNELLEQDYEIVIATNAQHNGSIVDDKVAWIREHIPDFNLSNVIFTDRKELINCDILIDDAPHYLERFPGITIAMDKPYNEHVKTDLRVYDNNGIELYHLIKRWGL